LRGFVFGVDSSLHRTVNRQLNSLTLTQQEIETMKQFLSVSMPVLIFGLCLPSVSVSQTAPPSKASEATKMEVIRIVTEQLAAVGRGDMKAYGKDMAEELIYITSDGFAYSKDAILSRTLNAFTAGVGKRFEDLEKVQVIENGPSAILTSQVVEHVIHAESQFVERFQRSEHFVQRDGRWQAVLIQFTEIAENHLVPVNVESRKLDGFVGKYAWTKGIVNTITKDGGKLMSQWRANGSKVELLALNDTTFFTRDDTGETIFMKDGAGRVTHYIYRRPDGQLGHATRLP
jgi:ketosteroid isomerase-like protein